MIPLLDFTKQDPPPLSLDDALKHLRSAIVSQEPTSSLFTDPKMNGAIEEKIKSFPQALLEQAHLARVSIPRLLAQVIHRNHQIISAGVQAFGSGLTRSKVAVE